jgi:hypothetical protein
VFKVECYINFSNQISSYAVLVATASSLIAKLKVANKAATQQKSYKRKQV